MGAMKSFLLLALASLTTFLASCAGPSCWSGGIPLRDIEERARTQAYIDFGDTSNAKVYRGLAHPQGQTSLYNKQVKKGGWIGIEDFKFFEEPLDIPRDHIEKVLALYGEPKSHQAWGPKEKCDGFHPDYVVVWSSGGTRRVLQLCYGCHEWKFFGPGGMLLTDISEKAYFGPLTRKWLKAPRE